MTVVPPAGANLRGAVDLSSLVNRPPAGAPEIETGAAGERSASDEPEARLGVPPHEVKATTVGSPSTRVLTTGLLLSTSPVNANDCVRIRLTAGSIEEALGSLFLGTAKRRACPAPRTATVTSKNPTTIARHKLSLHSARIRIWIRREGKSSFPAESLRDR